MSKMSEYHADLETISRIMGDGEPTTSSEIAEDQIARELHSMIDRLDQFCGMTLNPETVDLVEREAIAFGQINTRIQLILSFLNARTNRAQFRVVRP